MGYSSGHKRDTKRRILAAARRLFSASGYAATSIEQVMRECSLTRGGFYAHFRSKAQLHREAFAEGVSIEAELAEALDSAAGPRSRFAFLATDVASPEPGVRSAYTAAFTSISEKSSLSAAAMLVGALAVARTTDDAGLRARLLAACRDNIGALRASVPADPVFFWEPSSAS